MIRKIIATIKAVAYILIVTLFLVIPIFIARNILVRLLSFKGDEIGMAPKPLSNLANKLSKTVDYLMG